MISVEEAQRLLLAAAAPLERESVALEDAAGRILAAPLASTRTQPPFPSSAMDGYAVRAAEMPGPVTVVGQSAAGRRYPEPLHHAQAVRIFTGAPVPDGADAVLIQEDAAVDGALVRATAVVRAGDNIRREGLDFRAGDPLLPAGVPLAPRHLALAGAGGHAELVVARRPRVAFLATGDELVRPGAPTGPDQIVASITPALAAMVREAGGTTLDLGIAPDSAEEIARRAEDGLAAADVLVTLGGASVGDHDLVKPALALIGIVPDFWRVALRPGKPLMFSSRPLVLGLPGNPVSGAVCAVLFLLPLVRALQGATEPLPREVAAVLEAPVAANGIRRDYMRATLHDGKVSPFGVQDSSMLSALARANCLLVRAPHAPAADAGEACRVLAL